MMKSTLFLAAGAIIFKTGTRKIKEMAGIGFKMPVTLGCFTLAAPGHDWHTALNGFISKLILSMGALWMPASLPLFSLLILSSLMNGIYYLPIIISAFSASKGRAQMEPGFFGAQAFHVDSHCGSGGIVSGLWPVAHKSAFEMGANCCQSSAGSW